MTVRIGIDKVCGVWFWQLVVWGRFTEVDLEEGFDSVRIYRGTARTACTAPHAPARAQACTHGRTNGCMHARTHVRVRVARTHALHARIRRCVDGAVGFGILVMAY